MQLSIPGKRHEQTGDPLHGAGYVHELDIPKACSRADRERPSPVIMGTPRGPRTAGMELEPTSQKKLGPGHARVHKNWNLTYAACMPGASTTS